MAANVRIDIISPHGGKTRMDVNPDQMARLVELLDDNRAMRDTFVSWFAKKITPHANERIAP